MMPTQLTAEYRGRRNSPQNTYEISLIIQLTVLSNKWGHPKSGDFCMQKGKLPYVYISNHNYVLTSYVNAPMRLFDNSLIYEKPIKTNQRDWVQISAILTKVSMGLFVVSLHWYSWYSIAIIMILTDLALCRGTLSPSYLASEWSLSDLMSKSLVDIVVVGNEKVGKSNLLKSYPEKNYLIFCLCLLWVSVCKWVCLLLMVVAFITRYHSCDPEQAVVTVKSLSYSSKRH